MQIITLGASGSVIDKFEHEKNQSFVEVVYFPKTLADTRLM